MEIIARPRQAGKTSKVLKLAEKHFAYIICPDRKQAMLIWEQALKKKINIPMPITWKEFIDKKYCSSGIKGGFVIDNVNMCL